MCVYLASAMLVMIVSGGGHAEWRERCPPPVPGTAALFGERKIRLSVFPVTAFLHPLVTAAFLTSAAYFLLISFFMAISTVISRALAP